jgi:SAM-dependent methyltransferase
VSMPVSENVTPRCRICENMVGNVRYQVREMMFGMQETFTYFQCSECHCVQLEDLLSDLSKYYPPTYYSITVSPPRQFSNPIIRIIKRIRNSYAVFGRGALGKLLCHWFPHETLQPLSRISLTKNSSILDVGCGAGAALYSLRELGFSNIMGIDPFIKEDILYPNGLKILKKTIKEIESKWDVIMFHHSFEHLSDPVECLRSVARLLLPNGTCVIVIPTVSSYAWKHYGVHWVQLDAPRHFFLHSLESIKFLANKAGLQLVDVVYNSTPFQFWGSEQYLRGISLISDNSYWINPSRSIFSKKDIKRFSQMANKMNAEKCGDSAAYYFKNNNICSSFS